MAAEHQFSFSPEIPALLRFEIEFESAGRVEARACMADEAARRKPPVDVDPLVLRGFQLRDDFAAIERAAGRIGFSEETGQMCTHMGAAAPGFTEQALAFHHTADGIAIASRERDRGRVLGQLGATLEACTSCHSTWKQQVVDEASWQRLTSTARGTAR